MHLFSLHICFMCSLINALMHLISGYIQINVPQGFRPHTEALNHASSLEIWQERWIRQSAQLWFLLTCMRWRERLARLSEDPSN